MRVRSVFLVLVSLIAVGCGGGKKSPSAQTPPRLTEKEFVSSGNLVCVRSDRRVYLIGSLSDNPAGWARTVAAADTSLRQMSALRPPAAEQAGFDHLLALGRALRNGIQRVHDALVKKDYAAATKAQSAATKVDTKIHKQAQLLGLTFCQQPLTNWPA